MPRYGTRNAISRAILMDKLLYIYTLAINKSYYLILNLLVQRELFHSISSSYLYEAMVLALNSPSSLVTTAKTSITRDTIII
jgi:hypothetical protein